MNHTLFILLLFLTGLNNAQTVTIGTQVWMTKNLDVSTFRNGDPIPEAKTDEEWEKAGENKQPAWCYYNNDPANGTIYGKLYNWYAVAGIYDAASLNDPSLRKQLAPQGWHIPSDAEWTILTDFLGGESVAGGKMKETGTTHWDSPNTGATNESGFTALPGGYRYNYSAFYSINFNSYWWSSTEYDSANSLLRNINYNYGYLGGGNHLKEFGFSVRCIKN